MDLQEVKQALSDLELRIVERERAMEEDKTIIAYLRGYISGIEYQNSKKA